MHFLTFPSLLWLPSSPEAPPFRVFCVLVLLPPPTLQQPHSILIELLPPNSSHFSNCYFPRLNFSDQSIIRGHQQGSPGCVLQAHVRPPANWLHQLTCGKIGLIKCPLLQFWEPINDVKWGCTIVVSYFHNFPVQKKRIVLILCQLCSYLKFRYV